MDWQSIVPMERALKDTDLSRAREVRLRPGQPLQALLPGGVWQGVHPLTTSEILQAAQALSGYALAARTQELRQGFIPLAGGHRLGVCGRMGPGGMTEISSLCVRTAHEIRGVGAAIFPQVRNRSTLIAGPPGSGKTTLLRDLIRLHSEAGISVGVADERGEIAGCFQGAPQLDVGPCCDVITGGNKAEALRLLLRAMSPRMLATDELGAPGEIAALAEALRWGVRLLATVHGGGLCDLRRRKTLSPLLGPGGFEQVVVLRGVGVPPEIEEAGKCGC